MNFSSSRDGESKLTYEEIGNFVMLPHTFIKDARKRKLRFHARWLFVALMYYRNGKTGNAFPSYDTLHELTGIHRNMISKCLRELESAGWISLKRRFNRTTVYTLNFPKPEGESQIKSAHADDSSDEIHSGNHGHDNSYFGADEYPQ